MREEIMNRVAEEIRVEVKQNVLAKVEYQLINAERNEDLIVGMPHKKFLDLVAVYRVIAYENEMEKVSFLISDGMCEHYGLDEEEIDNAARQNTERKGFLVVSMESILAEITGKPENATETGCLMWVLTNPKKLNGAAVMLYPNTFKDLADRIGGDLYVLPSSIHEIIAVPAYGVEMEELNRLKEIVGAVNSSEVSEKEFLSGNVYKYIRSENRIVIA